MSQAMMLGQKLIVDVVRATGLAQMNHFTGDHPYVQCEVKHLDRHERTTKAATKPMTVGDTMNPIWNERLEIQPWQPGEDLEFTIYDKGLIGARTEGKVSLPSGNFYPQGYTGMLPVNGLPNAYLQVSVQPAGGATSTYGATSGVTYAAQAAPAAYTGATPATYSMPQASSGATYGSTMQPMQYSSSNMCQYSASTPTAGTTMMTPSSYTQSMPMQASPAYTQSAMPMQTYSSPANTYSSSTPMMSSSPAMPVQNATYNASPVQTYASPPSPTYMQQQPQTYMQQQPQTYMQQGGQMYGGGAYGTGAYKLAVSIIQAQGLKHLNSFTGDHPYVICEVKHAAHRERNTKVETKPVTAGDSLNPLWNETHELEPWHPGEPLEFSVYDKGLLGSKTEGKATLPGELFFPNGFSGTLPIAGLSHALLYVAVRVIGPSAITVEANSGLFAPTTSTTEQAVVQQQVVTQDGFVETQQVVVSKKKNKKLKVGSKKKSGCC